MRGSDEYFEAITYGMNLEDDPEFATDVINEAITNNGTDLWEMIRDEDYEGVVTHMYNNHYDIPAEVADRYLVEDIYEDDIILPDYIVPDTPYTNDRSFLTGAEFAGSLQIVEIENEKVYIPSSYYCHTKAFNKFLELQGRGKDIIPLEGRGVNPYSMSKMKFLNHILKYVIKCDCMEVNGEKRCSVECYTEKRKRFNEGGSKAKEYYKTCSSTTPIDESDPDNFLPPTICRIWWEESKGKVMVVPISNKKQSHPKMCIGLALINGTNTCHALLIKDYHNLKKEDIAIRISKDKALYPGVKKFIGYRYKDPKPYAVSWDIETWVYPKLNLCVKCRKKNYNSDKKYICKGETECGCKYSYKLNVASIGYEIINVVERKILQPCKIIYNSRIREDDDISLFDTFFSNLHKECMELGISQVNLYAHNGGRFDNIFAKKSKVVKFDSEISNGNNIKCLRLVIDLSGYKLRISMLDTLPFTLQSLKEACNTFKTDICKEEFDIINKSRFWYKINSSPELLKKVMSNPLLKKDYIRNYIDIHMKCNFNISISYDEDNKISCPVEYADYVKNLALKEMRDMKTYKDWKKYLQYDVRSLSNLIFNIELMYKEFGFSITNYVGLPSIAMDMMNSYCYNLSKLYVPADPSMIEICKASIKGGRVLHFKSSWDSTIKNGEYEDYLICIDMNSLYPSAMYACSYPTGKPKLVGKKELESGDWKKYLHYLGEFEIKIPNIRYAIHPYKSKEGALLYPSNQTIIDVYNDVDIREMIKDGYEVRMIKGVYWVKSDKIFSELVNMIFNKRNEYKSKNPADPDFNKEYICKILLNSMFGKFNETIKSLVKFFDGSEEEMKSILNKKSRFMKMENGQYRISETLDIPKISKPTYIAGYVTAYSRAICNELFRKVGVDNIYYSDTDSIYLRYSDFKKANLSCSNKLCGFKNDYGDGVMITKARFLDIKRCYFEFRTKVDKECFDKWGAHRLSCKDPVTKEVNKGEAYYTKTFKFKYTGINFRDITNSNIFAPSEKLFCNNKTYEEYNLVMSNVSKIVDEFIAKNKENLGKNVDECEYVKFMMQRFKKSGIEVTININEYAFLVRKEKRGQWIDDEYYALGFDRNKEEAKLFQNGEIGDLEKRFKDIKTAQFGMMIFENNTNMKYLISRRPLFYNIRMHIECAKDMVMKKYIRFSTKNKYLLMLNKVENKDEYIQKIFDKYIKYVEDVKSGVVKKDAVKNGMMVQFLEVVTDKFIMPEWKKIVNKMITNDVIIDIKREFVTDYYIEFLSDEIPTELKYEDYNKKYRILNKLYRYEKREKIDEYFIPNFINVKERAYPNLDRLYPLIMLSTRFNKDLGNNNLENRQAINIGRNII